MYILQEIELLKCVQERAMKLVKWLEIKMWRSCWSLQLPERWLQWGKHQSLNWGPVQCFYKWSGYRNRMPTRHMELGGAVDFLGADVIQKFWQIGELSNHQLHEVQQQQVQDSACEMEQRLGNNRLKSRPRERDLEVYVESDSAEGPCSQKSKLVHQAWHCQPGEERDGPTVRWCGTRHIT